MTPHDKRLAEIRQRAEKAAEGPWRKVKGEDSKIFGPKSIFEAAVIHGSFSDEDFIANSREDIPYLLTRIDALARALEYINENCVGSVDFAFDPPEINMIKKALSPAPGDGNEEVIFDRDRSGKVTYDHGADERYREQRDGKE